MGEHHTLLGTEILLEEVRDEDNPSKKFVKDVGLTSQRIHFKEVNVHPEDDTMRDDGEEVEEGQGTVKDNPMGRDKGKGKGKGKGKVQVRSGKGKARPRKKRENEAESHLES